MKEIKLTRGKVALVDDEMFEELNKYKWCYDGRGYAFRTENKTGVFMHRLIMNTPKEMDTDHINCNKLDNRKDNLRICNRSENMQNTEIRMSNTSGYKGVTFITNKQKRVKRWMAQITNNYKHSVIGYFHTPEDAAKAYDKKAKEYFGEFARTNFGGNCENSD